jgi:hypothetical protein
MLGSVSASASNSRTDQIGEILTLGTSITATNDHSNQGIITKVRKVDEEGQRTLGIITKPDLVPHGSGTEKTFIELAGNSDIFFQLGWHVLKNRKFEEKDYSFEERNASEATYFKTSNFKCLPKDTVGIESLRIRLSQLLFAHVKQELPKLQADLEGALADTEDQLDVLGINRCTPQECRSFLIQFSQECHLVCKAAVDGHYQDRYFISETDDVFSVTSLPSIRRLRAVIQKLNEDFNTMFRHNGHTYQVSDSTIIPPILAFNPHAPTELTRDEALSWVEKALARNRGRELSGNFNPLVVGELFWDQSKKWEALAKAHVEDVAETCSRFLEDLFKVKYPKDIYSRLWTSQIQDALNTRERQALLELCRLTEDVKSYPINYNHYYTDTVKKGRQKREMDILSTVLADSATASKTQPITLPDGRTVDLSQLTKGKVDIDRVTLNFKNTVNPNMERYGCEEALDCVLAIYKVSSHLGNCHSESKSNTRNHCFVKFWPVREANLPGS